MIKNIMYATKKNNKDIDFELKIITQYPDHFKVNTLTSQIVEEDKSSDSNESDSKSEDDSSSSSDDSDNEESHLKMA